MKRNMTITTLTICFIFFARPAHAYIDPGTGSMLLQILIAGVVGALFTLKTFGKNIKSFFSSRNSKHSFQAIRKTKNQ